MTRLIVMPIVAGFIATAGMTAFMKWIDSNGWAECDMVRAIGSLITRSYENALGIGMVAHFINGMIIAALYLHTLSVINVANLVGEVFLGGLFGFVQGLVVGWGIVRIAHRHPVEKFQKADYEAALAHIIGHVVYGVVIGALYGGMRIAGFDVSPGI